MIAVVHGCSIPAQDPILGEFTNAAGGMALSVHQCLPQVCNQWVPSVVLLQEEHKLSAFCVGFIEKHALKGGVVSQQYNGKQNLSPNTEQ